MEKLINLTDGAVLKFSQDNYCAYSGCETCDYGSSYVSELDIQMMNHRIHIESSQMYESPLSDGILMNVILSNYRLIDGLMSEIEFYDWLVKELSEVCDIESEIEEV